MISKISSWSSSLRCRFLNFLPRPWSTFISSLILHSYSPSGLCPGRDSLSPLRLLVFDIISCESETYSVDSFVFFVISSRILVTSIPHIFNSSTGSLNASKLVSSYSHCIRYGSKKGSHSSSLSVCSSSSSLSSCMMSSARGYISLPSRSCCCIETTPVQ